MDVTATVDEIGRALRTGAVSSAGLVDAALSRAARHERLGVFADRFDEAARSAAEQADRELADGRDRGPLHGIPVTVKDVVATREAPTRANSRAPGVGLAAGRDATIVARLRDGGAVVLGKTTTTEVGVGLPDPDSGFPVPRNPWADDRWAGGSSSGAASGVAAGIVPVGIGGDAAGSIRMPAAFCGVTGLAPTLGTVPADGCLPLAPSVGRIGPIGRTAADCAHLLGVLTGAVTAVPPGDPELRIGIVHPPGHLDTAVDRAFADAVDALAGSGPRPREVTLPYWPEVVDAVLLTIACEGLARHRRSLGEHWSSWGVAARGLLARGALVAGADLVAAQRVRRIAHDAVAALFDDLDVLVCPTASIGAPRLDELAGPSGQQDDDGGVFTAVHTAYWNGVPNPVLAVPIGFTDDRLPLSMQLVGPEHGDERLLRIGALYQDRTTWHRRQPPATVDAGAA